MREPLLWPNDIWTVEEFEPWQLKGFWQRILDLINEKKEKIEIRVKLR
jgi:hypothetical protein